MKVLFWYVISTAFALWGIYHMGGQRDFVGCLAIGFALLFAQFLGKALDD